MAKGRTNAPLQIVVAGQWYRHAAIEKLREAGHTITVYGENEAAAPDAIFHPAAHGWCEVMFVEEEKKDGTKYTPYLDAALTAARKRKREAK